MKKIKKLLVVLIITIEVLMSIIIIVARESIIIGSYNQNSTVYKLISRKVELPPNATIKYVVKGVIWGNGIGYSVYYKTDKINSKIFRLRTTDHTIEELDEYAVPTACYCLIVIVLTILICYIIKNKGIKKL